MASLQECEAALQALAAALRRGRPRPAAQARRRPHGVVPRDRPRRRLLRAAERRHVGDAACRTDARRRRRRRRCGWPPRSDDLVALVDGDAHAAGGLGDRPAARSRRACSTCSGCAPCSEPRPRAAGRQRGRARRRCRPTQRHLGAQRVVAVTLDHTRPSDQRRRPARQRADVPLDLDLRVRLSEPAQVASTTYVGRLPAGAASSAARSVTPVSTSRLSAPPRTAPEHVGVEPVPDDERRARADPLDRLAVQRRVGLARDQRLAGR